MKKTTQLNKTKKNLENTKIRQDSKGKLTYAKTTHVSKIHGEKAYKLLALQYKLSGNKAKDLIDRGLVHINGIRLEIARKTLPFNTKFDILESKNTIVYEDKDLLVIDKNIGIESYELEKIYNYTLINRLDRDTSGIILLAKNNNTLNLAIKEFKNKNVTKIYYALVYGKIYDSITINKKIKTIKTNNAKSYISENGQEAISVVQPIRIIGNKTLIELSIYTGKTHQIRIHLASIHNPIIGDIIYNSNKQKAKRLMLHCYKTVIFGKEFRSKMDIEKEFGLIDNLT